MLVLRSYISFLHARYIFVIPISRANYVYIILYASCVYKYIYICKDTICEKAQTISFVERGFERLGLGHQAMGFPGYSYMVKFSSPLESFS